MTHRMNENNDRVMNQRDAEFPFDARLFQCGQIGAFRCTRRYSIMKERFSANLRVLSTKCRRSNGVQQITNATEHKRRPYVFSPTRLSNKYYIVLFRRKLPFLSHRYIFRVSGAFTCSCI